MALTIHDLRITDALDREDAMTAPKPKPKPDPEPEPDPPEPGPDEEPTIDQRVAALEDRMTMLEERVAAPPVGIGRRP